MRFLIQSSVGICALASGILQAGEISVVTNMPGLVAFWTFGEEAGQPRISLGTQETHPLS